MSYTHLSRDDRISLEALLSVGLSFRACALKLNTSPTTIANEIRINGGRDVYKGKTAHRHYLKRRRAANQCHRILGKDDKATAMVINLLGDDWSPEQVIGRVNLELGFKISSPTTIYNYINPRRELHYLLPRKCNRYRRTKAAGLHRALRDNISKKQSIDLRPEAVNNRQEISHWEGDTIVGKERTARILTHVERKSGYLLATLMTTVSADRISQISTRSFKQLPEDKARTITYDNGTEFASFETTNRRTGMDIYFAHPYHSWERGTNENTNGLIRRYYPKGTYFSKINPKQFKTVVESINHRPRKRLGYKTPYEVFHGVTVRTLM
jgi:IS30 family transposase